MSQLNTISVLNRNRSFDDTVVYCLTVAAFVVGEFPTVVMPRDRGVNTAATGVFQNDGTFRGTSYRCYFIGIQKEDGGGNSLF